MPKSNQMNKITKNFRYDINALRAIAVLGVVFFHFNVQYFEGGFSGVDIFFVISGYLMTKIVINGLATDKFSILDFYYKRVQRIVPALMGLILIVVSVTFFFYLPVDYREVTKNGTASLLFYSNILYANRDYFDASSDNNIFLHTWSLSVEWQFYLLLPIILYLLNKIFKNDKRKFLIVFISVTALIFMFSAYMSMRKPTESFYYLPTRSWEMLMGGIAFLVEDKIKWKFGKFTAIIGYLILGGCLVFLKEQLNWPGMFTLIPTLATFLIIISNYNDFKVLKFGAIQFTGKVSYSMYLWHWPILVAGSYLGFFTSSFSDILILIVLSYILAYCSYTYIENIKFNAPKYLISAAILLIAITIFFTLNQANRISFKDATLQIADYPVYHQKERNEQFTAPSCFISSITNEEEKFNKQQCLYIDKNKKNFILMGDSHAGQFSQTFRTELNKKNINLIQASASGCIAVLNTSGAARCTDIINYMYDDFIPSNAADIDGIIISSNWVNTSPNELVKRIRKTIDFLNKKNIPFVILGQNKTYTLAYPTIAAREFESGTVLALKTNDLLKSNFSTNYIDIYDLDDFPKLSQKNVPYMLDDNHFSKYGAELVAYQIFKDQKFSKFIGQ
jgi:peptidoglycan/LPS O-acetylase OafA/YrhL